MNKHSSVARWTREAVAMLRAAADPRVAEQAKSYFKPVERVAVLGVRTPKVREIEREIYRTVKPGWTITDAVRFCDTLIRSKHLEAKGVGVLLLSRYTRQLDRNLFDTVRRWLADGYCDNWASTDGLSTAVLAPLLRRYPELLEKLSGWTTSTNLWVRRAAAVALTPLARKGEHLDAAYRVADRLMIGPEDLIHKAVGWLLRECGKTDDRRLEAFLLERGADIPRTALRYAIERFPEPRRRRILEQTRPDSQSPAGKDSDRSKP